MFCSDAVKYAIYELSFLAELFEFLKMFASDYDVDGEYCFF